MSKQKLLAMFLIHHVFSSSHAHTLMHTVRTCTRTCTCTHKQTQTHTHTHTCTQNKHLKYTAYIHNPSQLCSRNQKECQDWLKVFWACGLPAPYNNLTHNYLCWTIIIYSTYSNNNTLWVLASYPQKIFILL